MKINRFFCIANLKKCYTSPVGVKQLDLARSNVDGKNSLVQLMIVSHIALEK